MINKSNHLHMPCIFILLWQIVILLAFTLSWSQLTSIEWGLSHINLIYFLGFTPSWMYYVCCRIPGTCFGWFVLLILRFQKQRNKAVPLTAPAVLNVAEFASLDDVNEHDINIPLSILHHGYNSSPSISVSSFRPGLLILHLLLF